MTKNLAIKKIQGVSNAQLKKNLIRREELKENPDHVLFDFFKASKSISSEQNVKINYTIFVPKNLLKEISLNFNIL
jgi:hypothetical protein